MGVYDQAARWAANTDPGPVVIRLQREQGKQLQFLELGESRTTPRPGGLDRTADRVFVLADEDHLPPLWLLVAEFQGQPDEDKLDTTLVEVAQLRATARYGADRKGKYKVLAGLVYLVGECPQNVLDMTLTSGAGTRHAALVWNVGNDSASAALDELEAERITWGILFWVALMKRASDRELVRRWLRLARLVPANEQGGLRTVALFFAELAGCRPVWQDELEEWAVTESPLLNSWIERSQLQQGREWLVACLKARFPGDLTPEVIETINQQPSLSLLRSWYDAALAAKSYDDFLKVLRKRPRKGRTRA
jgi:hypothetical protein